MAEDMGGLFLGELDTGEEPVENCINIRGSKVTLKLDSGAEVQ